MLKKLKRFLIGRPLKNEALSSEKFGILWGLPILSSDAISSVAYAGQEVLIVLIPAVGMLAFKQLTFISFAIILLLSIITLSYRQTIVSYPNGGGAYIVAKDNIGVIAGVVAGAALSIGYILTVAVSISAGVEQIASAFTQLKPYTVPICALVIILMALGNLRGIKESAVFFSLPTYAFIFSMIAMIVVGIIKLANGYVPKPPILTQNNLQPISLFLILKAFTNGCAALTGVEAVSNSVPNFKEPSAKNAKAVLLLLSILVLIVFGGTSIIANFYKVDPTQGAMLIQISEMIFGRGTLFYIFTGLTFTILVLAANTAFYGFPNLISVMAREGFAPRQLSLMGDRLSYSNGIILLSAISILLIVIFKANVTSLIGLYAIGVFISFTLSQIGMFVKWFKQKGEKWVLKAAINGFGGMVTFLTVIIIAITKFKQGTWIVVVIIPLLVFLMLKVRTHYLAVAKQLSISNEELKSIKIKTDTYHNRVIVPIQSINKTSIRTLRYASTISDNVIAFNVSLNEKEAQKIKEKWALMDTDIALVVKYSPFRKVLEPMIKFIESAEYDYNKGDMITVVLAQFGVKRLWHQLLHNHSRVFLENELLKHKHIVVSVMPLQLKDDQFIYKEGLFAALKKDDSNH
jgi:amino acid transporter